MKNSTSLFLHRIFKGIADATIKIFIPLLIFQATSNLSFCFIYALVNYASMALFFVILKKFMQKCSIISIIIHIFPIIIAEFLLLSNLNIWIILILAILDAFSNCLYYGSLNLIFGTIDENTDTAKFEAGQNVGKIIFTILSAYILGNLVNSIIFIVIFSLVFYAISIVPLCIKYKELKSKTATQTKADVKVILKDNKFYSYFHVCNAFISFFLEIFLPIYLYINGLSFTVVGLLVAGQYLINILAGYLAKYICFKNLPLLNIILSSVLFTVSIIAIIFIKNIYIIYVLTIVFSFANQLSFITVFERFTLDQKEKKFFYHSIFYRDVVLNCSRSFSSSIYLILPYSLAIFGFGILASIGIGVTGSLCIKKRPIKLTQNTTINESNLNKS